MPQSNSQANSQDSTDTGGHVLKSIQAFISQQRLGDLLVGAGRLCPDRLDHALKQHRAKDMPLGQVLIADGFISRWDLRSTLFKQQILRYSAGAILVLASMGLNQRANADYLVDVPAKISLTKKANAAFKPMRAHPEVFETTERKSRDLDAFTKWTGMFERFDDALQAGEGYHELQAWRSELSELRSRSIHTMANRVNALVNKTAYKVDRKVWGKSDYWATPIEFLMRGAGDCEDFAIAKYTALRALGVPEERLRLAIVHDNVKNIPHAVLIVYSEKGPVVLDNQIKSLISADYKGRYRPIYSINRTAWWLHTARDDRAVVASSNY